MCSKWVENRAEVESLESEGENGGWEGVATGTVSDALFFNNVQRVHNDRSASCPPAAPSKAQSPPHVAPNCVYRKSTSYAWRFYPVLERGAKEGNAAKKASVGGSLF